jgi:hypothetical protein
MNTYKRKFTLCLLAALLGHAGMLSGGTPPHAQQPFSISSDTTFRSDSEEYEYKSSVFQAQDLWTLVGIRAHGQLSGPQQYHLWRVDAQGKKLRDIDLTTAAPLNRSQASESRAYGLVALNNGKLGLLVGSGGGTAFLSIDADTREAVSARPVKGLPRDSFVSKVLQNADGGVVLIGRADTRGLLAKLDNSGELQASSFIADPDLTVLTDGISLPDHGFILLGEHLDDSGKTTTWLARVNEKGEVLVKTKFAGQNGAISCSSPSHCGIIYALPGTKDWKIMVRTIDGNLGTAWETEVQSGLRLNPQWRLMARNNGTLLVAGGNAKQRLWVGALNQDGTLISSRIFEEPAVQWQRLWNFDLLPAQQELIIPLTQLIVGKELDQRQVFKVLRAQQP